MFDHPLSIFISVAEYRNFSKAAETLNMTQPAISQNIKNLEEAYGVKLFERSSRSVHLTYPGEVLLTYAKKMLQLQKESLVATRDADLKNTPLSVGTSMTVGEYVLPHLIALCKQLDNPMEIKVRIGNTKDMIAALLNNEIDVALVEGDVDQPNLTIEPFLNDELVLVLSPDHPLAEYNTVTTHELQKQTFILREQGSGTRKLAEDTLSLHGVKLSSMNLIEIGSTQAIKEFTEKGLGVAILSISTVQKEVGREQLKIARIQGGEMHRKFRFVSAPNKYITHSMARFKDIVFANNNFDLRSN
jgi:DNA-binding transcriptional LysR family regulator